MPFPLVDVAGSPREMGRQHGEQAREQVRAFAEHLIESNEASREEVLRATGFFRPLFEQHCPELGEEIAGVAEGAGISLEEAYLIQIRGEISGAMREGCTTFAVRETQTTTGGILIGQNSDMEGAMQEHFIVLRLRPERHPATLMWTFAGHLGYHGVNAAGVAHFANSLAGGPRWRRGLPHYPVKRRLYECRTREEVLRLWDSMPVCSSGNYMMAAGDPVIFDLEMTPEGYGELADPGCGYLAHANHFVSERFHTEETDREALPDSCARHERMTRLLRQGAGSLDVPAMQRILSDHENHPRSICRHEKSDERGMETVAGLIAEPQAGRLHVACGKPCAGDWTTYSL